MSPRPKGRVTDCTPEQARARRAQARAFLDVAEMVLEDDTPQTLAARVLAAEHRLLPAVVRALAGASRS